MYPPEKKTNKQRKQEEKEKEKKNKNKNMNKNNDRIQQRLKITHKTLAKQQYSEI